MMPDMIATERAVIMMRKKEKTANSKRTLHIWHIVCMSVGVLVCLGAVVMSMGYLTAQHKFSTEATLVDVDVEAKTRMRSKDDVNYSPTNKEETYYKYKLTWRFMNPESEKKYSYTRTDEASHPNAHKLWDKTTIYVYYNEDEADYELMEPFSAIIVVLAGAALIAFPVFDILRVIILRSRARSRDKKRTEVQQE